MPEPAGDIARRAAQRLAPELGPSLPAVLEARLQGGGPPQRFGAAITIALVALLLNAAKFAWDIWRDCKKDAKPVPPPETMARRMRLELHIEGGVSDAQRDKIIAVVVDEVSMMP